jgi:hypothetical protein
LDQNDKKGDLGAQTIVVWKATNINTTVNIHLCWNQRILEHKRKTVPTLEIKLIQSNPIYNPIYDPIFLDAFEKIAIQEKRFPFVQSTSSLVIKQFVQRGYKNCYSQGYLYLIHPDIKIRINDYPY